MVGVTAATIDILGTTVRLVAPPPLDVALTHLVSELPRADPDSTAADLVLEPRPDGALRLVDRGEVVRARVASDLALATVMWRLNAIAGCSLSHLVLHAGCVVADGGALVLPGPSGAGKSTLTAALVAAGHGYLSDEHAALDLGSGLLNPLPKPLDLDGALVTASSLRVGSVADRCAPAVVAFPTYQPGAQVTIEPLDPGEALLALSANTTNLALLGPTGFRWLAALSACPAWQITYGSTADALDVLHEVTSHLPTPAPIAPAATVPVTPTTTTIVLGDGAAVLDGASGAIHLLNRSAAFMWLSVADAGDRAELAASIRAELPPGALDDADVDATIEQLDGLGLLPFTT
jgi:hypothetical protein